MSKRFTITETALSGVKVIKRQHLGDQRGFFSRLFCAEELAEAGWHKPIAQINHTFTATKGTLRGLHFQHAPMAEMKLVICLRGAICDVAVDLRQGSPTLLQHHAEALSAGDGRALLIPEGCAHGFQALSDDVEILYFHSRPYAAASEDGLSPLDPRLAIPWPLAVSILSDRDSNHTPLAPDFEGLCL